MRIGRERRRIRDKKQRGGRRGGKGGDEGKMTKKRLMR